MHNVEISNTSFVVTFSRDPEEGLISTVATEGDISEDEAWVKVSDYFEGLLDQDVEAEVAEFLNEELGIAVKDTKSLWAWKNESGKLEAFSNSELTYVVHREYFDLTLERELTDDEWLALGEVFEGAVAHDHEVDLHYADVQELLD